MLVYLSLCGRVWCSFVFTWSPICYRCCLATLTISKLLLIELAIYVAIMFNLYLIFFLILALTFWRSPRRKLYAITFDDIHELSRASKRVSRTDSSGDDSDDDVIVPHVQKRWLGRTLRSLTTDLGAIRDTVSMLTASATLPPRLNQTAREAFKCQICQYSIRPPMIITKCCQNILGCQVCVDTWYSGANSATRTCPMC